MPSDAQVWVDCPELREFVEASVAVWRAIDGLTESQDGHYSGLPPETDPRIRERAAWEAYKAVLDGRP